jgi:hypothetical protein
MVSGVEGGGEGAGEEGAGEEGVGSGDTPATATCGDTFAGSSQQLWQHVRVFAGSVDGEGLVVSWHLAGLAGTPTAPRRGRWGGGRVPSGLTNILHGSRRGGPHPTRVSSRRVRCYSEKYI